MLTGDQVLNARFLTIVMMAKLESKGLTRSRSPSAFTILRKEFGLTGSKADILSAAEEIRQQILGEKHDNY